MNCLELHCNAQEEQENKSLDPVVLEDDLVREELIDQAKTLYPNLDDWVIYSLVTVYLEDLKKESKESKKNLSQK